MFVLDLGNLGKQVFKTTRKQTSGFIWTFCTLYRKSLSTASLTIGKNAAIVSMKALVNYITADVLEYFMLRSFLACYVVEGKGFGSRLEGELFFRVHFFYAAAVCHDVCADAFRVWI